LLLPKATIKSSEFNPSAAIHKVIFGASVLNKDKIAQNYVVSMNSTGIIQWKVQTPMNVGVIGQIAGIAAKTDWLGIGIICRSGATCLPEDRIKL
jgi:hypothetical protein